MNRNKEQGWNTQPCFAHHITKSKSNYSQRDLVLEREMLWTLKCFSPPLKREWPLATASHSTIVYSVKPDLIGINRARKHFTMHTSAFLRRGYVVNQSGA